MENLFYILLSSAAVSGLVTIVTGQYFEHRRYLLDKKLELYMTYLEKIDHLFDSELFDHGKGMDEMFNRMIKASAEVHQLSWKIKLITKKKKIRKLTSDIAFQYDKLCDKDFATELVEKNKLDEAFAVVDEINEKRDLFLEEAGKEIKAWF